MTVTAELSPAKRQFYESTCQQLREEVNEINQTCEQELERVKQLIADLQERKGVVIEMYGKAREVLHQPNDMEE
jgi:signal transduction histidine kinase